LSALLGPLPGRDRGCALRNVVLLRVAAETFGRRAVFGANTRHNQESCPRRRPAAGGTGEQARDAAVTAASSVAIRRDSSGAAAPSASDQRPRNGDRPR